MEFYIDKHDPLSIIRQIRKRVRLIAAIVVFRMRDTQQAAGESAGTLSSGHAVSLQDGRRRFARPPRQSHIRIPAKI
jgi:hypothetical protein